MSETVKVRLPGGRLDAVKRHSRMFVAQDDLLVMLDSWTAVLEAGKAPRDVLGVLEQLRQQVAGLEFDR